ncbi:variable surface protein [Plasmodium gonderi]|uniref:Variable surface protein n=1 Tax=Plasmodium gonderi TaxID=77519 RepID=A0A1Y1JHL0_PLAGO|nr:variable surface protein [Plasmodium gonderi]GAW82019.1 variable surface protein [Plasmodium gonderi]
MACIYIENDLKELPSKKVYHSFENADDNCVHSHNYDGVARLINNEEWLNGYHNKIRNVLCYVYEKKSTEQFNSTECDYLYFWLGYVLHSDLIYSIKFRTIMETLKYFLNSVDLGGICTYDNYYYNIAFDDFMEFKLLFDFSKDYDHLDKLLSKGNRICNRVFRNYLVKYIIIYYKFKNNCNTSNNKDVHCEFFNTLFGRKTQEDLRGWNCILEESNTNHTTQEKHQDIAPRSPDQGIQRRETYTIVNDDNQGKQVNQPVSQDAYMNADLQNLIYELSEDSHLANVNTKFSPLMNILDSPSANSTSKSIVISSLVIGITVFSILLCKFTPVGYWLKKTIQGKSKRKRNIIIDRNIIEDYAIPEDLDSPRRFNVRYSHI